MAQIEIGLSLDYVPDWGIWEGVREYVQNAKDAEEFDDHPMMIEYVERTETLRIVTAGVVLPRKVLMIGKSGKRDGRNQRGKHGEGFDTGALALIRAGLRVTIYNGDEVWTPAIEPSEKYGGEPTLTFQIEDLRPAVEDLMVEITGLDQDVWFAMRKRFLFLTPPAPEDVHRFAHGAILLHDDYRALVFAKGVYVAKVQGLEMGYDLYDVELDRDRRVVDAWDLQWRLGQFWTAAIRDNPELHAGPAYRMLRNDALEMRGLRYHADARVAKALRGELEREHGTNAVPVLDEAMAQDIEGLGVRPIVVGPTVLDILEKTGETAAVLKERLRATPKEVYRLEDLDDREVEALHKWVYALVTPDEVVVVDFHAQETVALALPDGKIAISRIALFTAEQEPEPANKIAVVHAVAVQEATKARLRADMILATLLVATNDAGIKLP